MKMAGIIFIIMVYIIGELIVRHAEYKSNLIKKEREAELQRYRKEKENQLRWRT